MLKRIIIRTSEQVRLGIVLSISWFEEYGELLNVVQNSLIAGAILGLVGGVIGVFIMQRDMAFAVHGISEVSFAGASAALLLGVNVVAGSIVGSVLAAMIIGVLGVRSRHRNSIVAVLMPFGMGLGVLFLSLYPGRSANKFGLLTGHIVAVDDVHVVWLAVLGSIVLGMLVVLWRPLTFDSLDADIASARGIPTRALSLVFMVLVGLSVAVSVQIVGALLVMAILVTPAAAALHLSSAPLQTVVLSVVFAMVSMVGGMLIAVGSTLPMSPFVTTVSFLMYLGARMVAHIRQRRFRTGGVR